MKRTRWLILALVLCMAATLGGTIAYLTDSDGDVNVMTLGNVSINLEELERDGQGGFQPFQDDHMMHPIVGNLDDCDPWNLPTNVAFLDKIVRVHSTSQHANAYLRVYIGLPSALRHVDGGDLHALHMLDGRNIRLPDPAPTADWPWAYDEQHSRMGVDIDGVAYDMLCYAYQPLLTPGEVTAPVLAGLWLDSLLDSADDLPDHYAITVDGATQTLDYDFSNGLQVPILAQAVQADGFPDAAAAFQAAGMDNIDFSALLDIKNSRPLDDILQALLKLIANAFNVDDNAPVILSSPEYDLTNPDFTAQLQAISQADPEKQVELVPLSDDADNRTVTIILGDASLPENIVLTTDDQTELIIIGND